MSPRPPEYLAKLIEACCRGDNRAWHELIDLVGPYIFSLCRRNRLSREESFDIYGQVCLELVSSLARLRHPAGIFSFVGTITRRQIFAFYEKLKIAEFMEAELEQELPDLKVEGPDRAMEEVQRREALLQAMMRLPEKYFRLLRALFLDPAEPSYKEISEALGIPESSIGPLRGKALKKLERLLQTKRYKI